MTVLDRIKLSVSVKFQMDQLSFLSVKQSKLFQTSLSLWTDEVVHF